MVGGVIYAVGSGKVTDIKSAARLLGQFVGRAAGGARRVRATATEMTAKAALQPGVADSTSALRATMSQFRAIQVEASSAVSVAGNRAYLQHQFQSAASSTRPAGSEFSESELRDALQGTGVPPSGGAVAAPSGLPTTGAGPAPDFAFPSVDAAAPAMHGHPPAGSVPPPWEGAVPMRPTHARAASAAAPAAQYTATDLLCAALDAERAQTQEDSSIF